jgi:hypothetical protein
MGRLAAVLAMGVLGLLGCRDQTVSTKDFLAQGNAACAVAAKRISDLAVPRISRTAAPEQFAGYVDDYVAEMRLELTNLRAIGYPRGQRHQLEADYEDLDDELDAAERDPAEFRPQMLAADELALRRAGLTACQW